MQENNIEKTTGARVRCNCRCPRRARQVVWALDNLRHTGLWPLLIRRLSHTGLFLQLLHFFERITLDVAESSKGNSGGKNCLFHERVACKWVAKTLQEMTGRDSRRSAPLLYMSALKVHFWYFCVPIFHRATEHPTKQPATQKNSPLFGLKFPCFSFPF